MSIKKLLFSIITVCFTLLTTLILGEISIRLFTEPHGIPAPPPHSSFNPYKANKYIVNTRPYVYFHIPGSKYSQKLALYENEYSINSMGFRGKDLSRAPAPNLQRLAVIGDSIVEGHGVQPNQTLTSHLQKKLSESGWEVINLGVQGASPLYFAANLERYLYLNPDAVLLLIHENDLHEDELRETGYFSLPYLENRHALFSKGVLQFLYEKSRLLSFIDRTIKGLRRSPLEKIIKNNSQTSINNEDNENSSQRKSSYIIPPSKLDKRWEMSGEYLNYFHANLQKKDVDLLVSSLCTTTLAFPRVQEYIAYCSALESKVRQWAEQQGVPYLSLIPAMKRAFNENKKNNVLIFKDLHPTPLTHTILSAELYPFVYNNLIDGSDPTVGSE